MIYRATLLQGPAGGHRGTLLRPDQAVPEGREPADVRAGRVPGGCRLPQPPHEGHNPLIAIHPTCVVVLLAMLLNADLCLLYTGVYDNSLIL